MTEFIEKYQKVPVQKYDNKVNRESVVSVFVQTYQHVNYIKDCLDGILMQKTTFPFEILLGEDASTDGTREVCIEYAEKYPKKIRLFLHHRENNIKISGSPTGRFNFLYNLYSARGKYIALCEGDDYWTDPLKLQKQVGFLETNEEYSLCFHNALILWEDKSQPPRYFCAKDQKETSTIEDVIEKWFIPSASMVFRKEYIKPLPDWFKDIYNGDWALQMLLAEKGKIGYIDEVMSVYRKNEGSLSGGVGKNIEFVNNQKIKLLNYFNEYTNFKYNNIIINKIESLYISTNDYRLREKSKILYWLNNPVKLASKILLKINKLSHY